MNVRSIKWAEWPSIQANHGSSFACVSTKSLAQRLSNATWQASTWKSLTIFLVRFVTIQRLDPVPLLLFSYLTCPNGALRWKFVFHHGDPWGKKSINEQAKLMNQPHLLTETCTALCFRRESLSKYNMCDLARSKIQSVDYVWLCTKQQMISCMPAILSNYMYVVSIS